MKGLSWIPGRKFLLPLTVLISVALICWEATRLHQTKPSQFEHSVVRSDRVVLHQSEIFTQMSLGLEDAEFLHNAFHFQSLTGNLVRFSNQGRYEPYIAKSWTSGDRSWEFELHDGLTCENGEVISASSFVANLVASFKRMGAEEIQRTPFGKISGIELVFDSATEKQSKFTGLRAKDNRIRFEFEKEVGKELLEHLAMSPYAYLCSENFERGRWRQDGKIVSSGPFRLVSLSDNKNEVVLQRRPEWPLARGSSVDKVVITSEDPAQKTDDVIKMSYGVPRDLPLKNFVFEVPRALVSFKIATEENRFLRSKLHRKAIQFALEEQLAKATPRFHNYHRALAFFYGQASGHESALVRPKSVPRPEKPLILRGFPPNASVEKLHLQNLMTSALESLGWEYEIITSGFGSWAELQSKAYDIAFDRSHVDATLDPEFVRILFLSDIGPKYSDPGKRVANLLKRYDESPLPYREFLIQFNEIIRDEAAILPMFHRGFVWLLSPGILAGSISPLASILRYEELEFGAP